MQVFLELSGHPKANVRRVLVGRTTLIGRSRECGLQIASPSVSRKHCELRVTDGGVSVVDLGSSNGTFIDNERLPSGQERPLTSGRRLNVGGIRFEVTYAGPPAEDARSAERAGSAAQPAAAAAPPAVRDDLIVIDDDFVLDDVFESAGASPQIVPAGSRSSDRIDAADDEPDLAAMFADEEPAARPTAAATDDEPILGSDEDDAFAFLIDDAPAAVESRSGDGRVGRS